MTRSRITSPWIIRTKPNPRAKVRLFCFPYAGGGAGSFRSWENEILDIAEVCAIQLPGRSSRINEPPFVSMSHLIPAIAPVLKEWADRPMALFGHSMGAVIAFEVALHMRREYGCEPVHLFVSGRRAPQMGATDARTYALPEDKFVEELRRLNGTPKEVFDSPELLELMIPVLRADFEICQTYARFEGPPLGCPITAFGGLEDHEVSHEHLEGWGEQTTSSFSLHMLDGDHFFLNLSSARQSMLRMMSQSIYESVTRTTWIDPAAIREGIGERGTGESIRPNGGSYVF